MSAEAMLLEAFSGFSRAAESLEVSYRDLSSEVARLREELEERNAQLEHSLAENEKIRGELERILANLPCGVLVTDESGTITRSNTELARVLHLAEVGHELGDLPEAVRAILGRVEEETGEAECSPDGRGENWLAIRRAQLEAGREPGKIFIVRDISAQKRWEKERERERHGVALGEMAALLAHEIRNPLASLELFAGLLADEQLPGDAGRWVNHVQAGLRTLGTTVNSVLDFHHPGTSEPSALDLGEFVDQVHAFLQPLARRHSVSLARDHHLRGLIVSADPHRLQQVLLNLAGNALRLAPKGGHVAFHGEVVEDHAHRWAEIDVEDDGPGIAAENRERIFEPGFTTTPGRLGLGLAVCRKIAVEHGGTLSVTSAPGAGATFRLRLPLGDAA
jgi:two-component system, sensor histidine kinase FlrB